MAQSPRVRSHRYVALLRGINAGANSRITMVRLRQVCEAAGGENVRTYIASGNVVFDSALAAATLSSRLEAELEKAFGLSRAAIVLTAAELNQVVKRNPFPVALHGSTHVAFATGPIDPATAGRLESLESGEERAAVVGRQIYLYLPNGFASAALPGPRMSKLTPPVTIRTWRTVIALDKLAREGA